MIRFEFPTFQRVDDNPEIDRKTTPTVRRHYTDNRGQVLTHANSEDSKVVPVSSWQTGLISSLQHTTLDAPRPRVEMTLPPRVKQALDEGAFEDLREAAVLVAVIDRPEGPRIILTRRSGNLRRHAGQISFPGGSREASDQNAVDTALRESHEEIGLAPDGVEVVGYLDDYPTITGFRITPVVAIVPGNAQIAADQVEVVEVLEVPLDYLLDRNSYRREYLQHKGMDLPYYCISYCGHEIWGATAAMLWNLREKLDNVASHDKQATKKDSRSTTATRDIRNPRGEQV